MQTNTYQYGENTKTENQDSGELKYFAPHYSDEILKIDRAQKIDDNVDLLLTEFRGGGTSGSVVLYDSASSIESTTSVNPEESLMISEFRDILLNCSTEELEDQSAPFIVETREWLKSFGVKALNLLAKFMNSNYPNKYLLSDLFEMIGDVNNQASYEDRKLLLESNLRNTSPEIRYGAVLGLANMNSKASITHLEDALKEEKESLISNTIKSVISLLKK